MGQGSDYAKQIYEKRSPQPKSFAKATDSLQKGCIQREATKMVSGLEGKPYKEQVRSLGFVWSGEEETEGSS